MSGNVTVLNTVWENASSDYQDRVPVATRDNMTAVGNAILSYTTTTNEFLNALVNRISLVIVSDKMARNRLAPFKKGMLEYGADVEEIFTQMAAAQPFDTTTAETEVFKRKIPDVKAVFHRVNREDFYKTTIQEAMLKRAFTTSDGLGKLVSSIVNSLYSGDAHDEYILMKELVAKYADAENAPTDGTNNIGAGNRFAYVDVPKVVDQTTATDFFRFVKQTSTDMTFMSKDFNYGTDGNGVMTKSEKSEQVLLLHKNVDTYLNVDVLSWVFNDKHVDFDTQVVILDDFGSLNDCQAALVDKNWFMVWDKLLQTTNQYNAEGLYWNYWLHHHQILSTSPFQNAVMFRIPQA
jgi:hypothetical protein